VIIFPAWSFFLEPVAVGSGSFYVSRMLFSELLVGAIHPSNRPARFREPPPQLTKSSMTKFLSSMRRFSSWESSFVLLPSLRATFTDPPCRYRDCPYRSSVLVCGFWTRSCQDRSSPSGFSIVSSTRRRACASFWTAFFSYLSGLFESDALRITRLLCSSGSA